MGNVYLPAVRYEWCFFFREEISKHILSKENTNIYAVMYLRTHIKFYCDECVASGAYFQHYKLGLSLCKANINVSGRLNSKI